MGTRDKKEELYRGKVNRGETVSFDGDIYKAGQPVECTEERALAIGDKRVAWDRKLPKAQAKAAVAARRGKVITGTVNPGCTVSLKAITYKQGMKIEATEEEALAMGEKRITWDEPLPDEEQAEAIRQRRRDSMNRGPDSLPMTPNRMAPETAPLT